MKTQRTIIAAFVLMIAATFTLNANTEPGKMIVRLKQTSADILYLQVANLQEARTHVCLTDLQGKIWFSEYVWNENAYAKNLDLDGMPEGEYVLFVKNKLDQHIQPFARNSYDITFFETAKESATVVQTSAKGAKTGQLICRIHPTSKESLTVQLANLRKENTSILLNNLKSVPVIQEQVTDQNGYNKSFNLKGIDSGTYYFVIRTENTVQLQFFNKNSKGIQMAERLSFNPTANKQRLTAN